MSDYFGERYLEYNTTTGTRTVKITAGVPQGSVLDPDFWNVCYDELLKMTLPDETYLVGFADDIAALIIARDEVKRM